MERIVVDEPMRSQMARVVFRSEIRDVNGQLLGYFIPRTEVADYDGYECPLTDEQLDAIEREGGGRPLKDILADLAAAQ
jgi:hypothetical protein